MRLENAPSKDVTNESNDDSEIRTINASCYFEIRDLNEIGMREERWEYDTEERNCEEELEWKKRRKRDREREGE